MTVDTLHVDELRLLEAEAVHIIREVDCRTGTARTAVLGRQGLHRAATPGGEGVSAEPAAVS